MTWWYWTAVSWLTYGLWAVAMRRAAEIPVAWAYLISLVFTIPADILVLKQLRWESRPSVSGVMWAAAAALAGLAGSLSYLKANGPESNGSVVVALVATYPLVPLMWFLAQGEQEPRRLVGAVIVVIGTFVMVR